MVEFTEVVKLGPKTWPLCLPDSSNPDPDHLMGDSALLVGYGPDESTTLNQIRQKIEPQWVCDGLYTPENAAITKREDVRYQQERVLPNMFTDKSVICGSDPFSDAKGTCPGDSGGPLMIGVRDRQTFKTKATLFAVLHGGFIRCDNSDFPAIYTRITTPRIWNWLITEFINNTQPGKISFSLLQRY